MTYKELELNEEIKIIDVIRNFTDNVNVETVNKGRYINYAIKIEKEKEATVQVFPLKQGKTTLYAGAGQNKVLSTKIVQHIIAKCEIPKIENKVLSLRNMTDGDFDELVEYLTVCELTVSDIVDLSPAGKQVKITDKNNATLFLNKWSTGTFLVQGSSNVLKGIVIEGLVSLLPYKEIINAQLDSLKIKERANEILVDLKKNLPNSFDFLDTTLHAIISPSLVLKKSELQVLDYSCYTFPVLRGLEGYIKKLFLESEIVISDTFGDHVENGKVKASTVATINSVATIEAIEECYKYYKENRHILFHVDGTIIGTTIIDDIDVADSIINHTFALIESTYKTIRDGK